MIVPSSRSMIVPRTEEQPIDDEAQGHRDAEHRQRSLLHVVLQADRLAGVVLEVLDALLGLMLDVLEPLLGLVLDVLEPLLGFVLDLVDAPVDLLDLLDDRIGGFVYLVTDACSLIHFASSLASRAVRWPGTFICLARLTANIRATPPMMSRAPPTMAKAPQRASAV